MSTGAAASVRHGGTALGGGLRLLSDQLLLLSHKEELGLGEISERVICIWNGACCGHGLSGPAVVTTANLLYEDSLLC